MASTVQVITTDEEYAKAEAPSPVTMIKRIRMCTQDTVMQLNNGVLAKEVLLAESCTPPQD